MFTLFSLADLITTYSQKLHINEAEKRRKGRRRRKREEGVGSPLNSKPIHKQWNE